jgi:hypothetical protein
MVILFPTRSMMDVMYAVKRILRCQLAVIRRAY